MGKVNDALRLFIISAIFFGLFLLLLFVLPTLAFRALISNTQFYDECFGFLFSFIGTHSDGVQITVDFRLFHSEFNFFLLGPCSNE